MSQLVCWSVSYNMMGLFGGLIAADLRWNLPLVYGGLTVALIVMGVASPAAGAAIDRYGGRYAMAGGSVLNAIGCAGIAAAHRPAVYYAAWVCIGLAMRLTLYEAAFAALARIGGPEARRPMSQITLLGGLSATVSWPIGHMLAGDLGWRRAMLIYAVFALATVPLHLAIPNARYGQTIVEGTDPRSAPPARSARQGLLGGSLYAVGTTLAGFLNAGISPNLILMLGGFGLPAATAVWISALRGVGQSSARSCDILFGRRTHPLDLNVLGALLLPLCFTAGLLSGQFIAAAVVLSFFSGAANGIAAITRGTLPLVLFDHRSYAVLTGRLWAPSLMLSAMAPVTYAFVIERAGESGALYLSIVLALAMVATAIALKLMFPAADRVPPAPRGSAAPSRTSPP